MPPRENSRHSFTSAQQDAVGRLFLSDRVPLRFENRPDNASHVVRAGDTLWRLAAKFYAPLGRLPDRSAALLYWIIADFQPTPIHDPTVRLAEGTVLIIPSISTVLSRVLASPDTRVR